MVSISRTDVSPPMYGDTWQINMTKEEQETITCKVCHKPFKDGEKAFCCDVCGKMYHYDCMEWGKLPCRHRGREDSYFYGSVRVV